MAVVKDEKVTDVLPTGSSDGEALEAKESLLMQKEKTAKSGKYIPSYCASSNPLKALKDAIANGNHIGSLDVTCQVLSSPKSASRLSSDDFYFFLDRTLIEASRFRIANWMLYCFTELRNRLPKSRHVRRLLGFIHESRGGFQEATEIYRKLLDESPDDLATRKRMITVYTSSGRLPDAVDLLVKHLSEFQSDIQSWHHLGEIYWATGNYGQAAFCYEECLLHRSHDFYFLVSYAELLATSGQPNSLELSIEYYTLALKAQPTNLRGLWGLLWALVACEGQEGFSDNKSGKSKAGAARSQSNSNRQAAATEEATVGVLIKATASKLKTLYVDIIAEHNISGKKDPGSGCLGALDWMEAGIAVCEDFLCTPQVKVEA